MYYLEGLNRLPDYMRDGMRRYVERGVPPGHFITAVLENDLMEAFGRADDDNRQAMFAYCQYLYNDAPMGCHGSPAKVKEWIENGGLVGMGLMPDPNVAAEQEEAE